MTRLFTTLFIAASFIVACSTNALTKKSQLTLMPESELQAMGTQQYQQFLSTSRVISASSNRDAEMVRRVGQRITRAVQEYYTQNGISDKLNGFNWEYNLVDDKAVNAWCMPGGKIVVYTGLLPITQNEAALATVLGHEMAHATSRHGSQRVLQQNLAQTALTGVAMSLSDMDYDKQRAVMGALGAGTQFGVLMPFSRKDESEADAIGLLYMARAGYDPRESIRFWQRMENVGGSQPPEFLSSHPSHGTRIQQLQAEMPKALEEYNRSSHAETDSSR